MPDPVPDRDLPRRHLDDDPDAFTEVVRVHRHRLWAVAVSMLLGREDAADAVQEAMLSAYPSAQ
nr:hypothetical protein [Frankia sp. Cppng1_Ct_nod]